MHHLNPTRVQFDLLAQADIVGAIPALRGTALKSQLLKWVGNKQRFANEIVSFFPSYRRYFEPFVGSGAVLGTLAPKRAVAGDALGPLVEIWRTLVADPNTLVDWYRAHADRMKRIGKKQAFDEAKTSYNRKPNGADLLFISRACYGGIVRFRERDGAISTPCGVHEPISVDSFRKRVDVWYQRVRATEFVHADFEDVFADVRHGDVVYCDPPYSDSQSILYGAQRFSLPRLFEAIERAKSKGAFVALSIDGSKRSGRHQVPIEIPAGLFQREERLHCGRSMLRRFQLKGETLENEHVTDRLLLTE